LDELGLLLVIHLRLDAIGSEIRYSIAVASHVVLYASAIVEVSNLRTIEYVLLQRLVDFVVDVARPCSSGRTGGDLGWELGEYLTEVTGAFTTAIYKR